MNYMRRVLAGLLALAMVVWPAAQAGSVGNCGVFRTWNTGDQVTAGDLNSSFTTAATTNGTPACLDDYSASIAQMQTNTDPYAGQTESLATSTAGEFERLRYVLKNVFGLTQWYTHTDNVNFSGVGVARSSVQGAGAGAHVSAVGLHVWGLSARFPAITSVTDHQTGYFFPTAGHIGISIRDPNVNGGSKGGIEIARWHAQGLTLHHTAAIRFYHSTAFDSSQNSFHITALAVDNQDHLVLGHASAGMYIASTHIAMMHAGSFVTLQRHAVALTFHESAHLKANSLYADLIPKAAADFDGSSTARTVNFSFNVAAIIRNSIGQYVVRFAIPMLQNHYALTGLAFGTGSQGHWSGVASGDPQPTSTTVTINYISESGASTDCLHCTFVIFGPQ